jgi:SAM-dependent methyltransferase
MSFSLARKPMRNLDERTVRGFGEEWSSYNQRRLPDDEAEHRFAEYFSLIHWERLPTAAIVADIGCGSGRWAARVAPKVGVLHCVDASSRALGVARNNLAQFPNCHFHQASVDAVPLPLASLDLCYSLGVLHHVPDTQAAVEACALLLKPGAPLLLYLLYALDDRPAWFRGVWRIADGLRRIIARLPFRARRLTTDAIALFVYWPAARFCATAERYGRDPSGWPLSYYRDKSFYTMQTDALDRFGTALEQRFTRRQIESMMRKAGLDNIAFSSGPPFWCAVGYRRRV